MKHFKAVYEEYVEGRPIRRFLDIYAKDLDQATAKWCALRTSNEFLISLYKVVTPDEFWASRPQFG